MIPFYEFPGLLKKSVGAVPNAQAHVSISCEIRDPLIPKSLEGFDPDIPTQNKLLLLQLHNQSEVFIYRNIKPLFFLFFF